MLAQQSWNEVSVGAERRSFVVSECVARPRSIATASHTTQKKKSEEKKLMEGLSPSFFTSAILLG